MRKILGDIFLISLAVYSIIFWHPFAKPVGLVSPPDYTYVVFGLLTVLLIYLFARLFDMPVTVAILCDIFPAASRLTRSACCMFMWGFLGIFSAVTAFFLLIASNAAFDRGEHVVEESIPVSYAVVQARQRGGVADIVIYI